MRPFTEFRPGVFARWMDSEVVGGVIWRFDTRGRWRARNVADIGFCSGPLAHCLNAEDGAVAKLPTPAYLKTATELGA